MAVQTKDPALVKAIPGKTKSPLPNIALMLIEITDKSPKLGSSFFISYQNWTG